MLSKRLLCRSIVAVILLTLLCMQGVRCAYAYNELGPNSDLIILVPGQTRAVMPNFRALVPDSYHMALILTIGAGTLTASVRNASFLEDGADFIFGRAGFFNTTPVIGSTYSAGKLLTTLAVPVAGLGIIMTGIMSGWGDINFPLQLHMLFSLAPPEPGSSDNETSTP